VFLAEVGDVGRGRLEDPQAEQPEHRDDGEVVPVRGLQGGEQQGLELEVSQPRVGDSAGTVGHRRWSAGERASTPSMTRVR
jgi:hypothetical protein